MYILIKGLKDNYENKNHLENKIKLEINKK